MFSKYEFVDRSHAVYHPRASAASCHVDSPIHGSYVRNQPIITHAPHKCSIRSTTVGNISTDYVPPVHFIETRDKMFLLIDSSDVQLEGYRKEKKIYYQQYSHVYYVKQSNNSFKKSQLIISEPHCQLIDISAISDSCY